MRVLITGGTGLIGRALVSSLPFDTHFTVLTRNRFNAAMLFDPYVELVSSLDDVDFNRLDCVINLAGEPIANRRWTKKQKKKIETSRFELTAMLTKKIKAAESPPAVFISGSAVGYYGRQESLNICENYKYPSDEFSHHLCSRWENLALEAASERTRVVSLRTGIVLSREGGALHKMLPQFLFYLGGKIGKGLQFMPWIHIADVVSAVEFIVADESINGPVNLTAPSPVTNVQFSKALASSINRPCVFTVPTLMLRAIFGEMADLLVYGQHVIPKKLMDAGFNFRYSRLDDALEDLIVGERKLSRIRGAKSVRNLHSI